MTLPPTHTHTQSPGLGGQPKCRMHLSPALVSGCLELCLPPPLCPLNRCSFILPPFLSLAHWPLSPSFRSDYSFHLPAPSLLHVPASVMVFVSVCLAGVLSPEWGQKAGSLSHCLGATRMYHTFMHAPHATLHKQVWVGSGLAPFAGHLAHAPGGRLHSCLGTGPQTHWRVPAAQHSDSDRPLV